VGRYHLGDHFCRFGSLGELDFRDEIYYDGFPIDFPKHNHLLTKVAMFTPCYPFMARKIDFEFSLTFGVRASYSRFHTSILHVQA
jgi:hypothetical protein